MQCPICKHNNRTQARFCVKCGSEIKKEIIETKEDEYKENDSRQSQKQVNNNDVSKKLAYVVTDSEIIDEDILAETVDKIIGEMIPYISTKVMNKRCFKYNIIDKVTIKDYISKVISKDEFLTIFLNLLNSITGLQNKGIKLNNLFLDITQIYVECSTLTVNLVCIPISNRCQDSTLEDLFKEIILKSEFDYNENCKYVKELLGYFSENKMVDIPILQGIVANMLEEEPQVPRIKKQNIKINTPEKEIIEEFESTTLLYENQGEDEFTTILGEEEQKVYYPHLIRKKNEEDIIIDKPIFCIGKDRNNADYFISDNPAISRNHAEIITRNGEYFIVDKDSTNHIYIDNEIIAANVEMKIVHENVIRLGNEEFEFEAF